MKITAMNIEEGMTIKVRGLKSKEVVGKRRIERLTNEIKQIESKGHINAYDRKEIQALKAELKVLQFELENKIFHFVERGVIKKSSPVLKINKVVYYDSLTYKAWEKKVTLKRIVLHTDQGNFSISDRQKVEVL